MKQVKFILSKLKKLLDSTKKSRLLCTYDFINETEISNLDLLKLVKYIESSKLAQKVGFLAEYLNSDKGKENENKRQNKINQRGVTAFLKRMKNNTSDNGLFELYGYIRHLHNELIGKHILSKFMQ